MSVKCRLSSYNCWSVCTVTYIYADVYRMSRLTQASWEYYIKCTNLYVSCKVTNSCLWSKNSRHHEAFLAKLTGPQLVKKFPVFHEIRRFCTAFTIAYLLFLAWARTGQFIPCTSHPTFWISSFMLSSQLLLGIPSDLLLTGPNENPTRPSLPAHLFLDLMTWIMFGEERHKAPSSV